MLQIKRAERELDSQVACSWWCLYLARPGVPGELVAACSRATAYFPNMPPRLPRFEASASHALCAHSTSGRYRALTSDTPEICSKRCPLGLPEPAPHHPAHCTRIRSRSDGLKRPEPTPGPPGLPFKKGPREADFRLRRLPRLWGRPRPPSRRPRPPRRWCQSRGWAERRFGDFGWLPVSPAPRYSWRPGRAAEAGA